jgi:xanthine dehydrogenase YagR molybdenum-binding subunit
MDELANKLHMDPLELRIRNYAEVDPHSVKPFTAKHLRECYQKAADRFGWSTRNYEPRSMRRGHELIGWGMATETYPGKNLPASALVRLKPDGRVLVASGTQEIGTGNYTILMQIAADVLGVPPATIDVRLAIFAEVAVDGDLGMTQVKRVVAVYDVGRIVNRQTARSQFIGGVVRGISLALHEDTHFDWRSGRITSANLADYHVPVNADIPEIDVEALDIPDYQLDSLGARGVGEIGITGTGAAICNAIFHATGNRVRDLPITPDKLVTANRPAADRSCLVTHHLLAVPMTQLSASGDKLGRRFGIAEFHAAFIQFLIDARLLKQ